MTSRLTPGTALLLTVPPLMWAGNAVVGRALHTLIPPMSLNFLRWALALCILLPLAGHVLRPASGLWPHWRRFALLGLLGVGAYNALQYLALQTSTPLNVTLVGASLPLWMLALGAVFFGTPVNRRQLAGALLSICGVLVVLSRGEWAVLMQLRIVAGDAFMLLATLCWACYSWLLVRHDEPPAIRNDWSAFLLAQMAFGVCWGGLFAGAEWALTPAQIAWGWPLAGALLYLAIGPSVVALRCWGAGVQRAGPAVAGFFNNLTPLFAALMSALFLGELPHLYHLAAFLLIAAGILVSSRR